MTRPTDIYGTPIEMGPWYWARIRTGQIAGTGKFASLIGSGGETTWFINGTGYDPANFTFVKVVGDPEVDFAYPQAGPRHGVEYLHPGEPAHESVLSENATPPTPEVLAMRVGDFNLPLKVVNALETGVQGSSQWMEHRSIITISDLLNHTADDLLQRRNFGPASLAQVQAVLAKQGLSLKEDTPSHVHLGETAVMSNSLINELIYRVTTIDDLASWHADLDADPDNQSPEDNVAHVNGLVVQECRKILALLQTAITLDTRG